MEKDWKNALSDLRSSMANDTDYSEEVSDTAEKTDSPEPKQTGPLSIITDKKGRNGKIATIIEGFNIPQAKVEEIARHLKHKLGVGGSVREGEILIQGDHRDKVKNFLNSMNFKTR